MIKTEKPVFAKVKEHRDLIRDMNSKALLNVDKEALSAHKIRRQEQQKTKQIFQDVEELKKDVSDIKNLMHRILEKIG
jgi:hypothetical protein